MFQNHMNRICVSRLFSFSFVVMATSESPIWSDFCMFFHVYECSCLCPPPSYALIVYSSYALVCCISTVVVVHWFSTLLSHFSFVALLKGASIFYANRCCMILLCCAYTTRAWEPGDWMLSHVMHVLNCACAGFNNTHVNQSFCLWLSRPSVVIQAWSLLTV